MRYLIAQGPGFYGVNIRQVPDDFEPKCGEGWTVVTGGSEPQPVWVATFGQTSVILTPTVEDNASSGFDTGWWKEGEAALDAVMGR
jgi:hypothetical protein